MSLSVNSKRQVRLDRVVKHAEPKSIKLTLPDGTEISATIEWNNYKPKINCLLNAYGFPLHIKPVIDVTVVSKQYILDTMQAQGVALDILDMIELDAEKTEHVFGLYEYTLVRGYVQSGKTQFMICQALVNYLHGYATLIVLRNFKCDQHQLVVRIKSFIERINRVVTRTTGNDNYFKFAICNPKNCKKLFKKQKGSPMIVVALANYSQLGEFRDFVEDTNQYGKVVSIIDEVDQLDHEGEDKRSAMIEDLKCMSRHVYGISATFIDTIAQEEIIPDRVKILQPLDAYKGVNNFVWYPIEEGKQLSKELLVSLEASDLVFETDPGIVEFLDAFSRWEPIYVPKYKTCHPVMYLMKITQRVSWMNAIQDYTRDTYPTEIASLVFNGYGIRLWLGEDCGPIRIGGKTVHPADSGYYLVKTTISEVIGFLKRNGGYEKYPRILIISGELAGRGISFVSDDYGECLEHETMGWHLIGQYYRCAKTTRQPELLQAMRMSGNIIDDIPLRIYTSPKVWDDLQKANRLQEKLFKDAYENAQEHSTTLKEELFNVPVRKSEIGRRKVGRTPGLNKKLHIVKTVGNECGSGPIFVIARDTLAGKSCQYYDLFCDAFLDEEDGFGTGKWFRKPDIMSKVSNVHNISDKLLTDTSHPWHDENKAAKHYKRSTDETTCGLLFRKSDTEGCWLMRYNVI